MLDCKIKSLLKYVCFVVSAVVIIYYFGGKRSEFLGNPVKSEMSSLRILSAEFEVFGIVQGESWSLTNFAYAGNKLNFHFSCVFSGVFFRKVS